MFHLTNISVAYDNEPVLHNITLHIEEGDKVVVIGQSGAGKSTLLRKLYDLQKRQAAFIHQDYASFRPFTTATWVDWISTVSSTTPSPSYAPKNANARKLHPYSTRST
ncbi:MAG: ATP-binding cassette domain-containing protein [bacterium]|nr:ATP-binding cassette domain-containing protein [bacterium]